MIEDALMEITKDVESIEAAICDLTTTCPCCGAELVPEHAHYRCATCGYRDSCCF
jgi:hypothetical protein